MNPAEPRITPCTLYRVDPVQTLSEIICHLLKGTSIEFLEEEYTLSWYELKKNLKQDIVKNSNSETQNQELL